MSNLRRHDAGDLTFEVALATLRTALFQEGAVEGRTYDIGVVGDDIVIVTSRGAQDTLAFVVSKDGLVRCADIARVNARARSDSILKELLLILDTDTSAGWKRGELIPAAPDGAGLS